MAACSQYSATCFSIFLKKRTILLKIKWLNESSMGMTYDYVSIMAFTLVPNGIALHGMKSYQNK